MTFKLIAFDLDGTLIEHTSFIWQTIQSHLGTDNAERKQAREDFFNKKISYKEWFEHDLKLWKEKGATKDQLLDAISDIKTMPYAHETLKELRDMRLKIVIISGSLDLVLKDHFDPDIFDHILINHIYFNSDGTIKGGTPTPFDLEHKATGLKEICKKENIQLKDSIFVGDHFNDIEVAKIAGLSIAFNSKSKELDDASDISIKDLREIPNIIRKR